MAYCHDKGIPHSKFLNDWSPADRAKVVAFSLEKADRCSGCGVAPWEILEDPNAYVAVRENCPVCAKREIMAGDKSVETMPGTTVVVMPRERAQHIADNPKEFYLDSPAQRRERRAAKQKEREQARVEAET